LLLFISSSPEGIKERNAGQERKEERDPSFNHFLFSSSQGKERGPQEDANTREASGEGEREEESLIPISSKEGGE